MQRIVVCVVSMEIAKLRIFGTPHIGVYIYANNKLAIIPPSADPDAKKLISEVLGINIVETKIAGSVLVGVMVTGNDHGLILPRNVHDEEYEVIKSAAKKYGLEVYVSRSKNTALNNLFLVNNYAGIVGSDFEKEELARISEVLDVEIFVKDVMNLVIPGSLAVVTDRGGIIHPDVSDEEVAEISKILKVPLEKATVNAGIPFVRSGVVANNKGVLVGENTTGPEILRIRRGFEHA